MQILVKNRTRANACNAFSHILPVTSAGGNGMMRFGSDKLLKEVTTTEVAPGHSSGGGNDLFFIA